jgi:hypothetical protein
MAEVCQGGKLLPSLQPLNRDRQNRAKDKIYLYTTVPVMYFL